VLTCDTIKKAFHAEPFELYPQENILEK